jgi:hypothetical protein
MCVCVSRCYEGGLRQNIPEFTRYQAVSEQKSICFSKLSLIQESKGVHIIKKSTKELE